MYGYVYLTTNLVNGRKYIGQHKSEQFTENYKGSGKILRQAFDKYGWSNFRVELLEECDSKEDLDRSEVKWISDMNAVYSDEYYNIAFGGSSRHGPISEDQKKALSEFGKTRTGCKNPFYGKHHTEETINKIKEANSKRDDFSSCGANRGKVIVNNGEVNKFISPDEDLPEGFVYGRKPFSQSHCDAISRGHKGKSVSEETRKKISANTSGSKNYWYGKSLPRHVIEASIASRRNNSEFSKKMSKAASERCTGRVWINDGVSNKFVKESEVEDFINQGYKVGRLVNFQVGLIWITDGVSNRKIRSDEPIPSGWRRGSSQRRKSV